ncbi:type IV pilus secretin PilQ [Pseudomonadales bacterium]|nr:type IV pilus secretin PilQ [Pseudomonadales bacterium]
MNSKMMPQQRMLIASVVLTMLHFISASALAVELRDVAFSMAGGDRTDITLTFDGVPPEPTGYAIAEPARISLDLLGVSSGLASKYHRLGSGNAQNLTILETQDRTRIIIALSELVGYSTQVRGRTLQLSVGRDLDASARSVSSAAPMPVNQARSNVDNVDFRRGSEGEGRVLIALSEPNIAVDLDQVGGRIVLTMPDTTVAPALIQQLDVTDFATPVEVIEVYQQGDQTVIEVVPSGEFDYLAYQSDQGFVLEVKPVIEEADTGGPRSKDFLYEGDKLSLNFQNIEIRAILQIVADFANLNLVASDAVAGAITLRLKDVPWDQALDIVLKTKGLDKRVQGNVLLVAPAAELADQERAQLENLQEIAELAPLRTELIKVKYANASDIVALFSSQGNGDQNNAGETAAGVVSDRGSILVDDRTNAIIVTETPSRIAQLRTLLNQLDIPVRQVMIEARIVKASDSFKREAGIRWGTAGNISWGDSPNGIQFGSSMETLGGAASENLIVDLGTGSGKTGGIAFGLVNNDLLLDLELQLFESEGMGETVSRPTIITSDKSSATVNSGSQIPYQSDTGGGATATAFVNATVGLTVTPQITADDRIILELDVTNNSRGDPTPGGPPAIDIESIQTKVIVSDGETVVLGGLYQTRTDLIQLKTPVLGNLPLVGRLFRNSARTKDKDELLIFITPKIIRESGDRVR